MTGAAGSDRFKALLVERENGRTSTQIRLLSDQQLPEGDVLVGVTCSSLNYKDGLAVTGRGKIVARYPHVPGVDFAGTVLDSKSDAFAPGEQVLLTGWGVGERHWGGFSQRARVKSDWLVRMPAGLNAHRAMAIGSAGLTAMLCVMTLEDAGIVPDSGPVVVTGAAGGVGSLAVVLLSELGYEVAAVTGRESTHGFLRELGATQLLSREEMSRPPRPLESQRWAGGIGVVGGVMLARLLAETRYGGAVAATGLAGDATLTTSVMPFILRNVSLRGVESVTPPRPLREVAWSRLSATLPQKSYQRIARVIPLEEVEAAAKAILAGEIRGRVLVDPNL
ncbi:MAG TPA: MDR family oxidoreductase [Gammaproteobacteria bacterium]|nr:MDR family oxidoreductase [Gammaproteobacteria bacterium]